MRLSPEAVQAIREEVARADPHAEVWLFGSRTRDDAKGGDIDLLVISEQLAFADELRLRAALLDRIGWQRLDLLVRPRARLTEPFAALALENGIRL
ncbi:MAG: nucleotidyltransferase domain-containing protein [Opitutaceae bacterium]